MAKKSSKLEQKICEAPKCNNPVPAGKRNYCSTECGKRVNRNKHADFSSPYVGGLKRGEVKFRPCPKCGAMIISDRGHRLCPKCRGGWGSLRTYKVSSPDR